MVVINEMGQTEHECTRIVWVVHETCMESLGPPKDAPFITLELRGILAPSL
jgi:hypothetical protein